ncbi:MAG: transposase [Saprospiraceae bacterium]
MRGKRKPGGQKGHNGTTLKIAGKPDRAYQHKPATTCPGCGASIRTAEQTVCSRQQVFDIPPPPPPVVTEHQIIQCNCPGCGAKLKGELPSEVATSPTSYGPRIAGFVAYFSVRHYLPYKRLAELVADVFGVSVSTGTIVNMIDRIARSFTPTVQAIKTTIGRANVIGSDETFVREGGRKTNIWI